jgi:chromosome segregation protein
MRLKSLKVFGFKTFAEATTLEFIPGTTAVVGPNGSGKSNLVDAIRWVLGEQSSRSLRSQKMEDVIFAGNATRKPLGMAEVTLTFDNEDRALPLDFAEVSITRRAYRAGDSEYFINRNHVRLRDVVDLLMGTGLGPGSYAIVSQGQIDAILSSKPTERRALFEETAGIGKFLTRKAEALRRLDGTEQNAIRVNDLIAELERRIPELDTQVRRAKRYRKVTARLRDLEILSYLRASTSRRDERTRVAAELDAVEQKRAAAAARAATLGAELSTLRNTLYTLELELEERRGAAQAARAEQSRIEADLAAAIARRDALDAQSSSSVAEGERVESERAELQSSIATLEERLAPLQSQTAGMRERELAASQSVSEARHALDAIYTELRAVEALAAERAASEAERRAQIASAKSEIDRVEAELARLAGERESLAQQAENARAAFSEREELVAKYEAEVAAQRAVAEAAQARGEAAATRVADLQTRYRQIANELASSESRLHTIEELEATLEGHVPGTRAIVEAAQRGELSGIFGVVSNLIEVDEQYARALDVAFGAGLSNLVTATSEDAERAVQYLRERELGRATFLPLDTLAQREGHELRGDLGNRPGVIGYAHTLVRTEPRFRGIVAFLVGRNLIVDTLPTGIKLVRGEGFRDSIVTLDGEQILGGGAITGGRYRRERSILARRAQAQSLRERIPELRFELEQIERDGAHAKTDMDDAAHARNAAITAANNAEVALRDVRTQLQSLAADIERLDGATGAAAERAQAVAASGDDVRARLHALEAVADDHVDLGEQRTQLEASLASARERIAEVESAQSAVVAEASSLREQIAALSAERDGAVTRLSLLDANAERAGAAREHMLAELAALRDKIVVLEAELGRANDAVRAGDAAVDESRRKREATADEAAQREADERIANQDDREATAAGENARRRLAEIDAELGMLQSSFAQNPATDEEQRDVVERYASEPDEVIDELPRLREELARLANVNLNAEADRDELAEREKFLRDQLDDLAKARETLLATIKEIETSCQVVFNETFEAVRTRFEEVFARLFPGGIAKMWQTDPDNLSETGIEIAVQPPGKKMTALAALSGGERAMTASALIFALIKVKPSPFYLLDEVDAALDDANVDRLSGMIREVSADAQMLIVTHNKKTMELAQRMYGVTMAEPGASSIISASLDVQPETAHPDIEESRETALVS